LFLEHIKYTEPETNAVLIHKWAVADVPGPWQKYLWRAYDVTPGDGTVIIFDEAQASYWDTGLWNSFFKPISCEWLNHRIIVFTSGGSARRAFAPEFTSMVITPCMRVTLRPIDHDDGTPRLAYFSHSWSFKISSRFCRHSKDIADFMTVFTPGSTMSQLDMWVR
jgi:hypothetical protein